MTIDTSNQLMVFIPMAGLGSRLRDHFGGVYKPFIRIGPKMIIERVIESCFSSYPNSSFFIALRSETLEMYSGEIQLLSRRHPLEVIELPCMTDGPAQTVSYGLSMSRSTVRSDQHLIVVDCDTEVFVPITESAAQVLLPYSLSVKPDYSYLDLAQNVVHEIVEKVPISNCAVVGHYIFESIDVFQNCYDVVQSRSAIHEQLMSEIVSVALESFRVEAIRATSWTPLGSVSEISEAQKLWL